jgi:hypothetical protein
MVLQGQGVRVGEQVHQGLPQDWNRSDSELYPILVHGNSGSVQYSRGLSYHREQTPSDPDHHPRQSPSKTQADQTKFKLRLNCWNCGKEGHPSWLCPDQETERSEKVCVTELPEEELHALAAIAMDLVDKEHEEEQAEQDF